ncbi:MAG: hypothetical protein HY326_11985 [Chloroflexi bacterium]|nr:hypothetical protein [Chloroflexota bacterium]
MSDLKSPPQTGLDPNYILTAEFDYIAQTAFQANEDRARVSNYYFVAAGAAVGAILNAKLEGATPVGVYWGFAAVFTVLSGIGFLTLLQLARLRSAWTESARAMNKIKDYYQRHCPQAALSEAFVWTGATLPQAHSRSSIAFLLAASILFIDAVTTVTTVVYIGLASGSAIGDPLWIAGGIVLGLLYAILQYFWYFRMLESRRLSAQN